MNWFSTRPIARFFALSLLIAVYGAVVGTQAVSLAWIAPLSVLTTLLFIAVPFSALFQGAQADWRPSKALLFILGGVLAQVVGVNLAFLPWLGASLATVGLLTWCLGLGALISSALKEQNLLLPVLIALACIDVFYVLTPVGITKKIITEHPEVLKSMALNVPKVQASPQVGPIQPMLLIGPADLMFTAMLFVALFKFKLRAKETVWVLIPMLVLYMALVFFSGLPLPALVPIGITFLLVNLSQFKLKKDEWAMTGVIALAFAALIAWGVTRKPTAAPLKQNHSLDTPKPASKPEPRGQDQPPISDPTGSGRTPSPP